MLWVGAELRRVESLGRLSRVCTTPAAIVFSDRRSYRMMEDGKTPTTRRRIGRDAMDRGGGMKRLRCPAVASHPVGRITHGYRCTIVSII